MDERISSTVIHLRPSQWLTFAGAKFVSKLQSLFPWIRQWAWYGFRRAILIYTLKHAIEVFWLCFKKRRLGVTFFRELTLMHWVPPSMYFDKDRNMKVFIRKCGYHDSTDAGLVGTGYGRKMAPWFYGEIKDETKQIMDRMEAKAIKRALIDKTFQADEMLAVTRVLKNFKEFSAEEVMDFFKASEFMTMEQGEIIFSAEDEEKYFYGVVSGEIHLFCDGIGRRGVELVKIVGPEECIASLLTLLHNFAIGPQKYEDFEMYATCAVSGSYYRVPIEKLLAYTKSNKKIMFEMLCTVFTRHLNFVTGINDLTGIMPRLHKQSYLDATYDPIDIEPGILSGTNVHKMRIPTLFFNLANEAYNHLSTYFEIDKDDRKLCWVGVLDSRTVLLRRFRKTPYAFFIHKGLVACTVSKLRRSYNAIQFYLSEGQIVGWREAILGLSMSVQFQVADGAKALVVAVPDFLLKRYFQMNPEKAEFLVIKLLERNSLLSRQISYTLRFSTCRHNEDIYRRGNLENESEATYGYLCLSGRLRFGIESSDIQTSNPPRYGIIEKGDWFGMVAMYNDNVTLHRTVICDRYCEYVAVPRYLMCAITNAFRETAGYQCDYMAREMHRDYEETFLDTDKMSDTHFQVDNFGVHTSRTYGVVCVYPTSSDIPGKIYCDELARHHTSAAAVVTREDALEGARLSEFTLENEYLLAKWLVCKEESVTVLFVLASNEHTDLWNETISKICDMIHVLVTYSVPHKPSDNETNLLQLAVKARKELVFIHPVVQVTKPQVGLAKFPHLPIGSILWLRPRKSWVQRHHHVRMLDSAFRYVKEKDSKCYEQYIEDTKDPDKHSDFARVMRWISGQSVGIVLGGGGAKGAAHLGTLHYLRELDVPVDYIAGVSIGSFLGALYAVYENMDVVESKAKELWENLKNPLRFARDITYNPLSALFRGHSLNWMINYFFGSTQIEDLYIPYFCVSTDLNDNCSRTHMTGDLWFYVRASMTLTMLFPPQINQFDYHLLMDGGYSDLVPAMAMRKMGIKYLVAINIGDERTVKTFNIGYHVSGFKCLLQSLMPHLIDHIPHHFEFWDALLYCSARNFIQILKAMDEYCIYVRPNVNAYTGRDFQYYDEIKRLGYLSTKFKFGGLRLKNLPVHVIWYLLRFYTYPYVAQSQSQLLEGFTDEDWQFAVSLMGKMQMFERANTPFLKMNLTPYLIDLMEARSHLEQFINDDDLSAKINLNVPVLENFFRDDERLDLVHALAKMKAWSYMEDFESIARRKSYGASAIALKVRANIHGQASQNYDLANAKLQLGTGATSEEAHGLEKHIRKTMEEVEVGPAFGGVKDTYSIRDLFVADPTMFQAVASYRHLEIKNLKKSDERKSRASYGFSLAGSESHVKQGGDHGGIRRSVFSLKSIISRFSKTNQVTGNRNGKGVAFADGLPKPSAQGQRLKDFRKNLTTADRRRGEFERIVPVLMLKDLKRSFKESTDRSQVP